VENPGFSTKFVENFQNVEQYNGRAFGAVYFSPRAFGAAAWPTPKTPPLPPPGGERRLRRLKWCAPRNETPLRGEKIPVKMKNQTALSCAYLSNKIMKDEILLYSPSDRLKMANFRLSS